MTASISWADMDDFLYPACKHTVDVPAFAAQPGQPQPQPAKRRCNKKLITTAEHEWFCESCNKQSDPDWRYRLQFNLQDHTGTLACLAFAVSSSPLAPFCRRSTPTLFAAVIQSSHHHLDHAVGNEWQPGNGSLYSYPGEILDC